MFVTVFIDVVDIIASDYRVLDVDSSSLNKTETESVRHIKLIREIWLSAFAGAILIAIISYTQLAFCVRNLV